MNTAAVEISGRNWLTAQLLLRGIEVAVPVVDRGVDLIAFREVGAAGIRALPLQLKCSSTESFNLNRKYEGRGIPLVYVWHALTAPLAFFLTYDEAFEVLGEAAAQTPSWNDNGYYAITRAGSDLRRRMDPYRDRWGWVEERLSQQPTSGA